MCVLQWGRELKELRRNYTLFIDESGQFGEEALKTERKSQHEQPSSQICGVLLPGVFEKRKGDQIYLVHYYRFFPKVNPCMPLRSLTKNVPIG